MSSPPTGEHAGQLIYPSGKRNDHFYGAWDKFLAIQSKRALETSTTAKKIEVEKKAVEETPGDGLQVQGNVATSWNEAALECQAKVAAIVKECNILNQNLDGRHPAAMASTEESPQRCQRVDDIFDNPQFFIDGAAATDVHQGNSSDCWFLASLMAVSAKSDLMDKLCVARHEQIGVYGFVFVRDGEFIYEVIDDKLFVHGGVGDGFDVVQGWNKAKKKGKAVKHDSERLKIELQTSGEALYFSHCKSNETWVPLIEKAYAKAHGDYFALEGGYASEGIEDLTGGVAVTLDPEDIMDKDRFWREQLLKVNQKYLFGGATRSTASKGLLENHAYAVLQAWEGAGIRLLKLRNPWGKVEWSGDWADGSKLWTVQMMTELKMTFGDEGIFWISYHDFLVPTPAGNSEYLISLTVWQKHFPSINRVRLLNDKQWQCAQQWTCVRVPWTVNYLDTKFQFTLSEQSDVVIVLCQPDSRFFDGLQGRYLHSLHFRVCKDGNKTKQHIVRSMHNSGDNKLSTRSVSAEVENLETGTYNVICKVTTNRFDSLPTEEDCIESISLLADSKEKLLHVGRRYDYAHSKGNRRAMEEQYKLDRIKVRKDGFKQARQYEKVYKERARGRKQRVENAMKEKRKAYAIACLKRDRRVRQRDLDRQRALDRGQQASVAAHTVEPGNEPKKDDATQSTGLDTTTSEGTLQQPDLGMVDSVAKNKIHHTEELSEGLSKLQLDDKQNSAQSTSDRVTPLADDDYESPLEAPEELDSDDFDWDSDLDGPVEESSDESSDEDSRKQRKKDIFADDPWNALCVLGIRVYSLNSKAEVCVIKSENGS